MKNLKIGQVIGFKIGSIMKHGTIKALSTVTGKERALVDLRDGTRLCGIDTDNVLSVNRG